MVTWRSVLLVDLGVIACLALIYFSVGRGPRPEWLACERLFAAAETPQDSLTIDRTVVPSARRGEPRAAVGPTCGDLRRLRSEQASRR